ncbi:MAG: hypothetical protein ACMUEM_00035 [Flavobacteriales bacterium AspAUS03]
MNDTEITNSEYIKFVYNVRDPIARILLAQKVEEAGGGRRR